jgi:hypothetical protein
MTNLPYDFDMLFDIKTVEELHDHLTGKQLTATSASHAELIEACHQYGVPLPETLAKASDSNEPLARTVRGLSTVLDICVIHTALKEAQEQAWEQTLKPLFANCTTVADTRAVTDKILAMRVDHDGTRLAFPEFLDQKIDAEVKRIHRASLSNDGPR